ncbi:MAG: cytochrome c3 family protein [Deltaproteobacteria bacterium]|nr:cytochrome c3 family protein [Deltaproteobacteria bacterium]
MRKTLLFLLAAAMVVLFSLPASAAIVGSKHDMTGLTGITWAGTQGTAGACSFCHIPHKATGAKAWSGAPGGTLGVIGTIGQLCYDCHNPTGKFQTSPTVVQINVFDTPTYHGLTSGSLPTGDTMVGSGLPYVNAAADNITPGLMECSTCHDPHNTAAGSDPFLQGANTVNNICQKCHQGRGDVAVATAQGFGAAGNPGTHPVNVLANAASATKPTTVPATMSQAYRGSVVSITGATPRTNAWQAGGHLNNGLTTGTVVCVTCHSIHGRQDAAQTTVVVFTDNTDAGAARKTLLSVVDSNNASSLCQGCHGTNPGNAANFTHPVNVATPDTTIFSTTTSPYQLGLGTGNAKALCRSCHGVHPASTGRVATAQTPLLYSALEGATPFCSQCHPGSATFIGNHHPANVPWSSGVAGIAANATALGLNNSAWATTNNIQCYNCHAGHNDLDNTSKLRIAKTAGVWGSTANTLTTTGFRGAWTAQCVGCHSGYPAFYTANQDGLRSQGSHFVGNVSTATPNLMDYVFAGTWPASTTAWSYYEGTTTAPRVACQSCHTLMNNGLPRTATQPLLLGNYSDNLEAQAIGTGNGPGLCRRCHIPTQDKSASAANTWFTGYQTTDTRTTLIQATHPLEKIQSGAATNIATYPIAAGAYVTYHTAPGTNTNNVNCESCHSAHGTYVGMGGYILKAASGGAGGTNYSGNFSPSASPTNWTTIQGLTRASWFPTTKDETGFCNLCHGQGTKAK